MSKKFHYTINNINELNSVINKTVFTYGEEEGLKFAELIKRLIKEEFIGSLKLHTSLKAGNDYTKAPEVIQALDNARITKGYKNGKMRFTVSIKNDTSALKDGLITALNDGTGIYNKDNPHIIRAKPGKYFFIPGYKFSRSLHKHLVTGKRNLSGRKVYSRKLINHLKEYSMLGDKTFKYGSMGKRGKL